jgi:aminoglycoside phosphotransferase (APT) family kinase protein
VTTSAETSESTAPTLDAGQLARLAAWMDARGLPGTGAPPKARHISGGAQNEIYEIRRGDLHCALRIPPPTAPPERDRGILREWRVIPRP